jgi:prepilin peptidase CpaA
MDLISASAALAATLAALLDARSRRIPNWLTGGTVVAGLLIHTWQGGSSGIVVSLAGAALGFAILIPLYALHAMGAGDVKLLAGIGAIVGPQLLLPIALYALIAGGFMSALVLARTGRLAIVVHQIAVLHRPPTRSGAKAPYAVAIAAGVYLSQILPTVLR